MKNSIEDTMQEYETYTIDDRTGKLIRLPLEHRQIRLQAWAALNAGMTPAEVNGFWPHIPRKVFLKKFKNEIRIAAGKNKAKEGVKRLKVRGWVDSKIDDVDQFEELNPTIQQHILKTIGKLIEEKTAPADVNVNISVQTAEIIEQGEARAVEMRKLRLISSDERGD